MVFAFRSFLTQFKNTRHALSLILQFPCVCVCVNFFDFKLIYACMPNAPQSCPAPHALQGYINARSGRPCIVRVSPAPLLLIVWPGGALSVKFIFMLRKKMTLSNYKNALWGLDRDVLILYGRFFRFKAFTLPVSNERNKYLSLYRYARFVFSERFILG